MLSDTIISSGFLDLFGSLLSFLTAYLASIFHRSTWGVSLCAIAVNATLYASHEIWGHFILDIFYAWCCFYGWQSWKVRVAPRSLSFKSRLLSLVIVGICSFIAYHLLTFIQGRVVLIDALGTSCALMAQLLTTMAYVESWPLWFIHDLMNLIIDIDRAWPYHALKDAMYLLIAIRGWRIWRQRETAKKA